MTSIYYRRKALTHSLRRELSNKHIVVPNPDHPLLIRGPDILVAEGQTISAIFMPLASERHAHGLLRSRLALSRLALPAHTHCILIVEPRDHHVAQFLVNDFAHVIEWSARENIVQIVSNRSKTSRHKDVPPEIIGDAQTRFANAMTVMRLVARLTANPFSAAFDEKINEIRSPDRSAIRRARHRPKIDRVGLEGVALAELSDFAVDTSTVKDLVYDQIEHVYALDNGIPYATNEPSGVAIVQNWPIRSRDSEKLILAAAFGGWAFVLEEIRAELPRFVKRLKQRKAP